MFLKLRRIVRFGRREEGVAAMEFALCLFPLLLILGGIIDFGLFCNMQLTITSASRAGARYATLYTVNASGQRLAPNNLSPTVSSYVTTNYSGLLPSNADLTATLADPAPLAPPLPRLLRELLRSPSRLLPSTTGLFLGHLVPGLTNPQTLSSAVEMSLE